MDHGTPVCECRQDNGEPVKKALRRNMKKALRRNSRLDKGPKCAIIHAIKEERARKPETCVTRKLVSVQEG